MVAGRILRHVPARRRLPGIGADPAGADAVHPHRRSGTDCQCMGEGHQPALGRCVGFAVRLRLPGARRGDVDDRACIGRQRRQCMLAAQERTMQRRQAALPFFPVHVLQQGAVRPGDTGIVDQAVNAAEALQGHRDEVAHAAFVGDVQPLERGIIAALPFGEAGLARLHIQIADQHAAAGPEHRLGDAAADAIGTAGDQHDPAVQRRNRPGGNRRHCAHDRSSPRRRRCQPSTPIRSRVWMLRSTITSGSG
ncbi:hypothetical protein D3C72_949680 [compost metagenome]